MNSPLDLVVAAGRPEGGPSERPELLGLLKAAQSIGARDTAQVLVELVFADTGKIVNDDTVAQWVTEQVGRLATAYGEQRTGVRVAEALLLGWVTKGKTRAGQRNTGDKLTIFLHVWRRLGPSEHRHNDDEAAWRAAVMRKSTEHLRRQVKDVLGQAWSGSARLAQQVGAPLPSSPSDLPDWEGDAATVTWGGPAWAKVQKGTFSLFGNFRTRAEEAATGKLLTNLIGLAKP
jgi:hypothetical protein